MSKPTNFEITVFNADTGEVLPKESVMYPRGCLPNPGKTLPKSRFGKALRALLQAAEDVEFQPGIYYCPRCKSKSVVSEVDTAGFYKDAKFNCSCGYRFGISIKNKRTVVE